MPNIIKGQNKVTTEAVSKAQFISGNESTITLPGEKKLDNKAVFNANKNLRIDRSNNLKTQYLLDAILMDYGYLNFSYMGAKITKDNTGYHTNAIANQMVIAALKTRSYLRAKQYTELEFLNYSVGAKGTSGSQMDPFVLFPIACHRVASKVIGFLKRVFVMEEFVVKLTDYFPVMPARFEKFQTFYS